MDYVDALAVQLAPVAGFRWRAKGFTTRFRATAGGGISTDLHQCPDISMAPLDCGSSPQ
jgi:hypothetical protein